MITRAKNQAPRRHLVSLCFTLVSATLILLVEQNLFAQRNFKSAGFCLSSSASVNTPSTADTTLADKAFVRALAIYVAFPDQPSQQLPAVASRLESELPNFIRCMSEGRQTLVLETARRPAPFDALCYVADSSMSFYQNKIPEPAPKTKGFDFITDEILDKVFADHPDFPEKYGVIFLNILGNFQRGTDGFSLLARGKRWERKFNGVGATMDLTAPEVFLGVVAHEYGHLLGAQHPPHFLEKSFGDYELMDQHLHRLAPYGVQNLMDFGWLAPERVQVVHDTLYNVELEDVRRGGKVLLLAMNAEQYLLVVNHQGSDYDAVYKGRGLLIWHQAGKTAARRAYSVWDLESAAGLSKEGRPDPIFGQDDFDRSRDSTGSSADFFRPEDAARFGPETNPSTNFYDQTASGLDWRGQAQASGIALTNLRQEGSTIRLDVFVPELPPKILLVKGPNAVEEPKSFFAVDVWTTSAGSEYTVEVLYRSGGATSFTSAKTQRLNEDRFTGEIPLQKAGTQVQYYVRVADGNGREELFPPTAPDSLLRFTIKPFLGNLVRIEPRTVTLSPGDSIDVPLVINNSSDLSLHMETRTLLYETPRDDRAYDTSAVAHELHVPEIFFDPQTNTNFNFYFEHTPAFYLRLPGYGSAVAKLHAAYDEHWVYLYFIMLKPRSVDFPFTLELIWRDSGFSQEAWVTATGSVILPLTKPAMPMQAAFLSDARGPLPKLLIKLSGEKLLRGLPPRALALRARFWSNRYSRANWPSVAAPEKFGHIIWRADSPFFQLETFVERLTPGGQHTRSLRFHAPKQPWAGELSSWLLVQLASPFDNKYFIPLVLKVKGFRSRFDSPDSTGPPHGNVLDPKPNGEPRASNSLPADFRVVGSFPNPFRTGTALPPSLRLRFFLPQADIIRAVVFDALGRRVVELAREEFTAGEHELLWNGKNSEGRRVLRGLYFIRLRTSTKTAFEKILVM